MEYRKLGKTGMNVSVLGFGGWEIGYQHISLRTVKKLLNEAVDAGINVIDTADCYATSEELIGEAVGKRRNEFYLLTKCGHESGWSYADWRPESLLRSIQRSLKRLKTDHLDLIQLHSCSEAELRKGAVIDTLKRARERGYTRFIGYSGDSQTALYAIECGEFDTLQTSISSPIRKHSTSFCLWQRSAISGSSPNAPSLTLLGKTVIGRQPTLMAGPTGKVAKIEV